MMPRESSAVWFLGRVRSLSNLLRMNYMPRVRQQNVAEHSFHVANLAAMVGHEILSYPDHHVAVDMNYLVQKALYHDFDESIVSDVPYPVKKGADGLAQSLEKYALDEMRYYGMPIPHQLVTDHPDMFLENKIVKLCDMAEFIMYCIEEVEMGNKFFISKIQEALHNWSTQDIVLQSEILSYIKDRAESIVRRETVAHSHIT